MAFPVGRENRVLVLIAVLNAVAWRLCGQRDSGCLDVSATAITVLIEEGALDAGRVKNLILGRSGRLTKTSVYPALYVVNTHNQALVLGNLCRMVLVM